jgi:hypothetical protein
LASKHVGVRGHEPPARIPLLGAALVGIASIIAVALLVRDRGTAATTAAPTSVTVASAALSLQRAASSTAPSNTAPSSAAPSVTLPARVELTVEVRPLHATIHVDGVLVAGNPFTGSFPRDASTHHVTASALGHASVARTVTFDQSQRLQLQLAPNALPPVPPAAHAHLPPEPTSRAEPRAPDPEPRPIDPDNPYR